MRRLPLPLLLLTLLLLVPQARRPLLLLMLLVLLLKRPPCLVVLLLPGQLQGMCLCTAAVHLSKQQTNAWTPTSQMTAQQLEIWLLYGPPSREAVASNSSNSSSRPRQRVSTSGTRCVRMPVCRTGRRVLMTHC